jgi:AhpD family alkylhydroperoxidase
VLLCCFADLLLCRVCSLHVTLRAVSAVSHADERGASLGDDAERGTRAGWGGTPQGGTLVTKRFFSLGRHQTYEEGALDEKTKELLGLVASMVLRCDDCIAYHIDQCVNDRVTAMRSCGRAFDVALIVGGSIVIPHMRRGVEFLDEARVAAR